MKKRKPKAKPEADKNAPKKQAAKSSTHRARTERRDTLAVESKRRLIVGIGASAGGLQAFKAFFANMPADSGMAFVLVQHLDPQHKSMLVELLSSVTAMRVNEAADGAAVAADNIYVIPPNATLQIAGGKLRVSKPAPAREHRRPVDTFFSSLAEDQKENAVCVILSGGGSDGTQGLREIKEHGGLTMAQAEFDEHAMSGMPMSATSTGLVDYVLAIEEMPAKLVAYNKHLLAVEPHKGPDGTRNDASDHLTKVYALLRAKLGHDFSQYKEKTLVRRIQRRMQVLQIGTMPEYIERLRKEPREYELLFRDLLIGVTHFFRDPLAFEALRTQVIPQLIRNKDANETVRVWIPACATGEEVYSIAILLKEAVDRRDSGPKFQIFATDIDDRAIAVARTARYRKSQIAEIPIAQRERWFVAEGDVLCPVKEIREMCIFSPHSVIKDPPFSKLDLISCRNLLIYLDTSLQERLLGAFHYALAPGGYLFLGTSESVTRQSRLFATLDQAHRIFQRRDVPATLPNVSSGMGTVVVGHGTNRPAAVTENGIEKSTRRLMEKHTPAYVVIDGNCDVLRFSGQTDKYVGPTPGAASLNLFNLLRRGLRPAARAALAKALTTRQPVTHQAVPFDLNGSRQLVDLIVEPVPDNNTGLCVIAFADRKPEAKSNLNEAAQTQSVDALEKELRTTRERLEATVDQLETSNEEMKSANEEYQSVNEELQSTNEELETSKEEMQSINEELQTVNAELSSKNDTLLRVNSDLKNFLDSTHIATLFLDRHLRIKNFTPTMTDLFHVRDGDRGRPVTDIVSRFSYDDLGKDAMRAMRDLSVVERAVRVPDGDLTFLMRLRPYRTVDDVIDGVVISFIDISERIRNEQDRAQLAAIVDASQDAIIGHSLEGTITSWNAGARNIFGRTAKEAIGKPLSILIGEHQSDEMPGILSQLAEGKLVRHFETHRVDGAGKQILISMTISPIRDQGGAMIGASTIARDITERERAERELQLSEARYRMLFEAMDEGFCVIEKIGTKSGAPSDFRYVVTNPSFAAQTGVGNVVGKTIREAFPGEPQEWFDTYDAILKTGNGIRFERDLVTQGRVLELYAFRVEGVQRQVAVIFADVTARKHADERQRLLMNELNHRVKNTLATVQSIAAQSLKGASDVAHREAFDARLVALSGTHDLLARDKWDSVMLHNLLDQEFGPYKSKHSARFSIEGKDLKLNPKAALALGLAFHELTTNAAKYGALTSPTGNIRVAWDVEGTSESRTLEIKWTESGGPPVKKRERRGFGSTLIERGLSLELDGEVQLDFAPGGLVCTMAIPLANAGAEREE